MRWCCSCCATLINPCAIDCFRLCRITGESKRSITSSQLICNKWYQIKCWLRSMTSGFSTALKLRKNEPNQINQAPGPTSVSSHRYWRLFPLKPPHRMHPAVIQHRRDILMNFQIKSGSFSSISSPSNRTAMDDNERKIEMRKGNQIKPFRFELFFFFAFVSVCVSCPPSAAPHPHKISDERVANEWKMKCNKRLSRIGMFFNAENLLFCFGGMRIDVLTWNA